MAFVIQFFYGGFGESIRMEWSLAEIEVLMDLSLLWNDWCRRHDL